MFAFSELQPPELFARSAILLEADSGMVLYEKNSETAIPPASLTKLMTLHLTYQKIKAGTVKKTDIVPITRNAWALSLPRHTSRMFLEPGQRVTVLELMQGLSVVSGNDAAIALAEYLSGSVENFVKEMNQEAQNLGLPELYFEDPSGISAQNRINARQFAEFCRIYLKLHPESLEELHSKTSMVYPKTENLDPRIKKKRTQILQHNRNTFLGQYPGVDGLKTGYIKESGFNIAISASKDNMRLIAVVLGVFGSSPRDGTRKRLQDGKNLLHYGFHHYTTLSPVLPSLPEVRVYKGSSEKAVLEIKEKPSMTVRAEEVRLVKSRIELETPVLAPVSRGQTLGHLVYFAGNKEIARYALKVKTPIESGGFLRRFWDSIVLAALSLMQAVGLA